MSTTTTIDTASRTWRARLAVAVLALTTLAACDEPTAVQPTTPDVTAQRTKFEPRDVSPHREGHVTTRTASLHFLDWGGKGPPLVLLTGLGDNAHIYDDLAPRLADRYHVVAITRRGYGQSSRPASGYAVDTLVDDVIAVLDHLQLDRVYLVGHSVAGNELTRLSVRYPERVDRLVYLDAAADRAAGIAARSDAALDIQDIINPPPPVAADLESFAAFVRYQQRITKGAWTPAREINLWHGVIVGRDGRVLALSTDDAIASMMAAESYRYHAEFSALQMPALAIGALPGSIFDAMPWLPPSVGGDSLVYANLFLGFYRNQIQNNLAGFAAAAPFGTTMFIDNTNHYVFVVNESDIVTALRGFLPAAMPTPPKHVAALAAARGDVVTR